MSEFKFQKYALMCMRLAAECRGLAANVPEPDLRAHLLHMASMWTELADQPRALVNDASTTAATITNAIATAQ